MFFWFSLRAHVGGLTGLQMPGADVRLDGAIGSKGGEKRTWSWRGLHSRSLQDLVEIIGRELSEI